MIEKKMIDTLQKVDPNSPEAHRLLMTFQTAFSAVRAKTPISRVTLQEQILAIFELTPEQLAQHPDQITPDTKAYVGDLVHTDSQGKIVPIFEKLVGVKHIYTSSPEEHIPSWNLKIGGKKPSELEKALDRAKIEVDLDVRRMISNGQFTTLDKPEIRRLVELYVSDIGFQTVPTTSQIFERIDELGLNKCDAEVGVYQRLVDQGQKPNTAYWIGMNPITDSGGIPRVFRLSHHVDGLELHGSWTHPASLWRFNSRLVFAFRK